MQFNKKNLAEIRSAIEKSMQELERQFNIKLSIGNIRFDDTSFKTTLEASTITADGFKELKEHDYLLMKLTAESPQFLPTKKPAVFEEFPPYEVIRNFKYNYKGMDFKITSFKSRSSKPIQLENKNKESLSASLNWLKQNLK